MIWFFPKFQEDKRGSDKLDWHIKKSRFVDEKETARIMKRGTKRISTFKEGFAKLFNLDEKSLVAKRKYESEEEESPMMNKKPRIEEGIIKE